MPGHSSLPSADCVNLSAVPGIHCLTAYQRERRGWPGQAWDKPGHDDFAIGRLKPNR